ncbi:cyclic pyranopterin monophosphate synthase subunit MoaC [Thermodesulfitimonas autotrophica]|uniref:Cyclic pyranopterin monophosphate synthase n=1 Tax=Thermodesulfitimonas autotrophica TaxID=1894989 RepID=A0A3N5AY25_9THEO|nr:cyclic pyranopterin monophosphate synthase MoaC [Thermodesulfitimonas autotrophica]RPF49899.1 cyclic pyranopterin monophosphate synthase subunit MoaC [Thermodesulfitimonas autotrophica]
MELTHLDAAGRARMVAVEEKPETLREAAAFGAVRVRPETLRLIAAGDMPKGDVLAVARVAGIMAAKETPRLVPLCHPVRLTSVAVDFMLNEAASRVEITARVKAMDRTGAEMEALTAVAVAALTLYDMVKAVDREAVIQEIRLEYKAGGKSGVYRRGGA